MVLASVGMALHHKLCHTLGGTFDLPHAETHTVVLPHAIAFNVVAAEHAGRIINRALGSNESENAGSALYDLAVELNAPIRLGEYGFQHRDIDKAAKRIIESKSFDNSALCTNESVLITFESIDKRLCQSLRQAGAYICDADDVIHKKRLEIVYEQMEKHNCHALVHSFTDNISWDL